MSRLRLTILLLAFCLFALGSAPGDPRFYLDFNARILTFQPERYFPTRRRELYRIVDKVS
jgi:hypothetical protein